MNFIDSQISEISDSLVKVGIQTKRLSICKSGYKSQLPGTAGAGTDDTDRNRKSRHFRFRSVIIITYWTISIRIKMWPALLLHLQQMSMIRL